MPFAYMATFLAGANYQHHLYVCPLRRTRRVEHMVRLFSGIIQAAVFVMLAIVYIQSRLE